MGALEEEGEREGLTSKATVGNFDPASSGLVSRRTAIFGNCRMFENKG